MKSKYIHMRINDLKKTFIELAASESHQTLTRIVLAATLKEAERILGVKFSDFKKKFNK